LFCCSEIASRPFFKLVFSSIFFSVEKTTKFRFKRLVHVATVAVVGSCFHSTMLFCVCVLPINGYRVIKLHFRPISEQHIHKHTWNYFFSLCFSLSLSLCVYTGRQVMMMMENRKQQPDERKRKRWG
jgi:hypothetical protein